MIKFNNIELKNDLTFVIRDLDIIIPNGELFVLVSRDNRFFDFLYNLIKGYEKNFSGTIEIQKNNKVDLEKTAIPWFECDPEWPIELKTDTIIKKIRSFLPISDDDFSQYWTDHGLSTLHEKRFSELSSSDKIWLAFSLFVLKRNGNYVFNDILKGQTFDLKEKVKNVFEEMKIREESILYLTDDIFLASEIGDRIGFVKNGRLEIIYTNAQLKDVGAQAAYGEHF